MLTLFISDLHLSPNQPHLNQLFIDFLSCYASQATALYILGDLFEYWIGDDHIPEFHHAIASALRQLTGVSVYLMPGNRDFLVSAHFIRAAGCQLLADPSVIDLYGQPVLLTHGDSLCTLDRAYLRFRYWARKPFLQTLFLKLPLKLRQRAAQYLSLVGPRLDSASALGLCDISTIPSWQDAGFLKRPVGKKGNDVSGQACLTSLCPTQDMTVMIDKRFDVVDQEVLAWMQCYHTRLLIHGHTHRPSIFCFRVGEAWSKRIVLSDWQQQAHALIYYPNGQSQLSYFL